MIKIKNCALFGGTFDPFHNGHLHLIKTLLATERFDCFVVIPAGDPYQKSLKASGEERLSMVKSALAHEDIEISDCEIRRSGPSYAIDTVNEMKVLFPSERFTWILGSDAFAGLPTWNRFEELSKLVNFMVVKRPGSPEPQPIPGVESEVVEISALDISSTSIRNHLKNGEDVGDLLPASVASYIKERGLYGAA